MLDWRRLGRCAMATEKPLRAHLITGGYPPGTLSGHDHDYVRLRLLQMLGEQRVACTVANDFSDVARWLETSRFLVTYVAGPYPDETQDAAIKAWLSTGGRWLGLHGTSGGRARRDDAGHRHMVKTSHHLTLGSFFLNHPPLREFTVDTHRREDILTRDLPATFAVTDELYMIELQDQAATRILLSTTDLPVDTTPPGFGFQYDRDT